MALVLALACTISAQSTPPDLSSFTPEQQKNATQFVDPQCIPSANSLLGSIQNGFSTQVVYTIVISCQGTSNNTATYTVPPFSISQPFLITPATGAVENRLCSLILQGIDPHDASPTPQTIAFQNYTTTCGAVQVRNRDFDEDADDDCTFMDAPCEYNTGSWFYGFVPTMIHAAILTTAILIPYGIFSGVSSRAVKNLLVGAGVSRRGYLQKLQTATDRWRQSDSPHPAHTFQPGGAPANRHGTRISVYDSEDDSDIDETEHMIDDYRGAEMIPMRNIPPMESQHSAPSYTVSNVDEDSDEEVEFEVEADSSVHALF